MPKKQWCSLFVVVVWSIWKWGNGVTFENQNGDIEGLICMKKGGLKLSLALIVILVQDAVVISARISYGGCVWNLILLVMKTDCFTCDEYAKKISFQLFQKLLFSASPKKLKIDFF